MTASVGPECRERIRDAALKADMRGPLGGDSCHSSADSEHPHVKSAQRKRLRGGAKSRVTHCAALQAEWRPQAAKKTGGARAHNLRTKIRSDQGAV